MQKRFYIKINGMCVPYSRLAEFLEIADDPTQSSWSHPGKSTIRPLTQQNAYLRQDCRVPD
jgi:hypothetical protein